MWAHLEVLMGGGVLPVLADVLVKVLVLLLRHIGRIARPDGLLGVDQRPLVHLVVVCR